MTINRTPLEKIKAKATPKIEPDRPIQIASIHTKIVPCKEVNPSDLKVEISFVRLNTDEDMELKIKKKP